MESHLLPRSKKKIGRRRSGRHLCVWTCSSLSIAVCFSFPAHTWSTAPFIASHQMACVFVCVYHVHSQLASDKLTDEVKFKKLLICDGKIKLSWSTPLPIRSCSISFLLLIPHHSQLKSAQHAICNQTDSQWLCPLAALIPDPINGSTVELGRWAYLGSEYTEEGSTFQNANLVKSWAHELLINFD